MLLYVVICFYFNLSHSVYTSVNTSVNTSVLYCVQKHIICCANNLLLALRGELTTL